MSAGYVSADYQDLRGWEEGVVEILQRLFRPVLLSRLAIAVAEELFDESRRPYGPYVDALERLRRVLGVPDSSDEGQRFYLDLLKTPIRDRPGLMMGLGLRGSQPRAFVQAFSLANATLKRRLMP